MLNILYKWLIHITLRAIQMTDYPEASDNSYWRLKLNVGIAPTGTACLVEI